MQIKVSKHSLISVIVLFFILRPDSLNNIDGGVTNVLSKFIYLCMFAFVIIKIFNRRSVKLFKEAWYVMAYFYVWIFSTLCYDISNFTNVRSVLKMLICIMIITYLWKMDNYKFLSNIWIVLFVYVVLNFVTVLMYPKGLYMNYFEYDQWGGVNVGQWIFGQKNSFAKYFILLLLVTGVRTILEEKRVLNKRFIICYLISLTSVLIVGSSTSIIVLIFLLMYLLLSSLLEKHNIINARNIYIFAIIINVIFISSNTQVFSGIIHTMTGKTATLSNRLTIWAKVLIYIKQRPILGYGYQSSGIQHRMFGHIEFNSTHNMLLQIFFFGGIVLFFLFLFILFKIINNIMRLSNKKMRYFLTAIVMAILIEGLAESLVNNVIVFICLQIIVSVCNRYLIEEKAKCGRGIMHEQEK